MPQTRVFLDIPTLPSFFGLPSRAELIGIQIDVPNCGIWVHYRLDVLNPDTVNDPEPEVVTGYAGMYFINNAEAESKHILQDRDPMRVPYRMQVVGDNKFEGWRAVMGTPLIAAITAELTELYSPIAE